ncbi:MAG: glycerate kinase [Phycisphaerae bacterium]|nr:glycerate kinase [Phycisphaerae bacterium]
MRIVIAPDSFKEALSAAEVCRAIARGVRRVCPDAVLDLVPMADGGEGTVDALIAATQGRRCSTTVCGPLAEPVVASWGMLGSPGRAAVLEMAAASGLGLVPPDRRNPLHTSTYGTGELIRAALEQGAERLLIGIGGSATTDGGAGAAQAVGVRFLDASGKALPEGLAGGRLADISRVDLASRDPRIAHVTIEAACDVDNPLCGPRGAAAVFGPQKGATPEQVARLDENLAHLARLVERDLGMSVADLPGAGAAGGLGAGLMAFFGAMLRPGIELVMQALKLADRLAGADLVITGEGRIDAQSMMGKVISGVGREARRCGVPAIALVGSVGQGAENAKEVLEGYFCINPPDTPWVEALARTAEALEATAVAVLRERISRP